MSKASVSIALANNRSEIPRLADIVQRFGTAHHMSDDDVGTFQLVLDEIVVNVIVHGYEDIGDVNPHQILVNVHLDGDVVTLEVKDDARAYNPTKAPVPRFDLPAEERRIGGLGVYIARSLMDSFEYRREDGHNIVTMTKKLAGRS